MFGKVTYGDEWRGSLVIANMKVITSIYLNCRPELRDEWLGGSDQDTELEDALVRPFLLIMRLRDTDSDLAARVCITSSNSVLQQAQLPHRHLPYG